MASPPTATDQQNGTLTKDDGVDVDVDAEMADTQDAPAQPRNPNETSSTNLDNEYSQPETQSAPGVAGLAHHDRKDVTLREFLSKMDDYAPIIPDAVTAHYLTVAGLPPPSPADPTGASTNTTPLPLARLLALATQKFVADIAADAYQYSRIRSSNTASSNNPLGSGGAGGPGGPSAAAVSGAGAAAKNQQATQLGVQRSGYGGGGQGGSGQGRTVLTMEDLGMAVQEYGINVKRGEFYR
ncbi:hypothetical protein PV10_05032 [Exophiala mesophila]|uniref:Transcription initiation factor TFIID subunit 10 n=1 Tax=Exophiala mesophila TaxID=212818 RepID=A0A0D2A4E2_EXOME|nr:uncharacterized protein PV10_05032 [Exophiala mesophila]KIV93848.1 hypothetical protein PV10_05032 [Exophiala mesophila]